MIFKLRIWAVFPSSIFQKLYKILILPARHIGLAFAVEEARIISRVGKIEKFSASPNCKSMEVSMTPEVLKFPIAGLQGDRGVLGGRSFPPLGKAMGVNVDARNDESGRGSDEDEISRII
jgi:hypothetical protein